jgi:undecaprenyl-diphosphatase
VLALSRLGSVGFIWILLAALLTLAWRHAEPLVLTAVTVLSADLLATGLKLLTDRPRPYVAHPEQHPLTNPVLDVSFPSGHAATAFAGATALARFLPGSAVPLYLVAAAVAWSRVYVGAHYVSDVIVGSALGVATTLLLLRAIRRLSPLTRRAG